MPHIPLPDGLPGIRGLFAFRLDTARPLSQLAQVLLHDENTLTRAERELIATYVSSLNDCYFCQTAHGALAEAHLEGNAVLVEQVKRDPENAPISDKLRALLAIAGRVQRGGKNVTTQDIERARRAGASDREVHDTVLIAAAFCMYNRYVDGLATWAPRDDQEGFRKRAATVAAAGYMKLIDDLEAASAAACPR
jgi:uncharacterized peroxidase-related enzyme